MGGYLLHEGDTLQFTFSGDTFSILGVEDGDGTIAVYIDGVEIEELTGDGNRLYSGPHSGSWKDVSLVVTQAADQGLHIDAIEVFGSGEPLPIPTSDDTGGDTGGDTGDDDDDDDDEESCEGCSSQQSGSGLPLLLIIALGAVTRRRT
jgi:hypothetical protein